MKTDKLYYLDVGHPGLVFVSVFETEFHPFERVHGFDEPDILFELDVGVENEILLKIERLDSADARFHQLSEKKYESLIVPF